MSNSEVPQENHSTVDVNKEELFRQYSEATHESFRATISWGQTAISSIFILNGGACIALLALMGSVWSKSNFCYGAIHLIISLGCFAGGVLLAAIASGTTYLSQGFYTRALPELLKGIQEGPVKKRGDYWRGWTVGLIMTSYFAFVAGVGFSAFAMYETFVSQEAIQSQHQTNQ